MELSSSNIKKILIFPEMKPCTSQPKHQKTKTFYHEKNPSCFRKWNILALILKEFLYFLKRSLFLYFLKRKLFLCFRKWNPALFTPSSKNQRNPPRENLLYFRKRNPLKNLLHFLKRKRFLCSRKREPRKKSLYFRKRNFPSSKNEKQKHF